MSKETFLEKCGDTTPRDRANQLRLLVAIFTWAVSFVAASWVVKGELMSPGPVLWLVAAAPTVIGVLVVLSYRRFLREADELQRLIQLQALALGFGASWLALSGYPIFEKLGAPPADPSDFIVVMAVFYSLGSFLGLRRYQ